MSLDQLRKNLVKAKDITLWVLENIPQSRDDVELFIRSCKHIAPQHKTESYTRARRHYQNTVGIFVPSDRVKQARDEAQEGYRQFFSPPKKTVKVKQFSDNIVGLE